MQLVTKIYKKGKFWLAEIPVLDAMTQGKTRSEAEDMLRSLLTDMVETKGFVARVIREYGHHYVTMTTHEPEVYRLILKRQRAKSGLTVRDVAAILGSKSPNAYAAYEKGDREPSLSMVFKLLDAVGKHDKPQVRIG